jgi:hypothetical protein
VFKRLHSLGSALAGILPLAVFGWPAHAATGLQAELKILISENALTVSGAGAHPAEVKVFTKHSSLPLFGSFVPPVFVPAVRFLGDTTYRVELRFQDGTVVSRDATLEATGAPRPTVGLSPDVERIPENTLRLYLNFSEPMEQGVLLQHLVLYEKGGRAVPGAFRETELWSPDGRRLTVMLHPGRQKTGVGLNQEEGPVLVAGRRYALAVSQRWRSAQGIPLGSPAVFAFEATEADHQQPDPNRWQIRAPRGGSLDPLWLLTDEVFEPDIFSRALRVEGVEGTATARLSGAQGIEWRFTPAQPWRRGEPLTVSVDPALEDLAGNTTWKTFEVDLSSPAAPQRTDRLRITLSPENWKSEKSGRN